MHGQGQHAGEGAQAHGRHEDQREDDLVDAARDVEHLAREVEHRQVGREVARREEAHRHGHDDREQRAPQGDLNGLDRGHPELVEEGPVGRHHPREEVADPGQAFAEFGDADLGAARGPPERHQHQRADADARPPAGGTGGARHEQGVGADVHHASSSARLCNGAGCAARAGLAFFAAPSSSPG